MCTGAMGSMLCPSLVVLRVLRRPVVCRLSFRLAGGYLGVIFCYKQIMFQCKRQKGEIFQSLRPPTDRLRQEVLTHVFLSRAESLQGSHSLPS